VIASRATLVLPFRKEPFLRRSWRRSGFAAEMRAGGSFAHSSVALNTIEVAKAPSNVGAGKQDRVDNHTMPVYGLTAFPSIWWWDVERTAKTAAER